MKLLHIDTSILGPGSVTREVTALIVKRITAGKQATVTYRDLAAEAPPHLTFASMPTDHPASAHAGPLDAAQQAVRDASQAMLDEFIAADVVVIGAPMYNFTIPSQLKAWIDRIIIPGKTFRYGANGPVGLVEGKRVVVAIARGGFYGPETGRDSAEHAESYLRSGFSFLGVTDLEFITAEGLSAGEESKGKAMASAREAIGQLTA